MYTAPCGALSAPFPSPPSPPIPATHAGERGSSGPCELDSQRAGCFEASAADSFQLLLPELGALQQLLLWIEGPAAAEQPPPSWRPAYLEAMHLPSGRVWYFVAGEWLGAAAADGATRRLLAASDAPPLAVRHPGAAPPLEATQQQQQQPPPQPQPPQPLQQLLADYLVEVQTSALPGAGTDASVFLQLLGQGGESEPLPLASPLAPLLRADGSWRLASRQAGGAAEGGASKGAAAVAAGGEGGGSDWVIGSAGGEPFQAGALDLFLLQGLPDVGRLHAIRIGHDGSGTHNGESAAAASAGAAITHRACWQHAGSGGLPA